MLARLGSLTRSFGGKLILFLVIDVAIAAIRNLMHNGGTSAFVGAFLLQIPYSVILAVIWSVADRKRIASK